MISELATLALDLASGTMRQKAEVTKRKTLLYSVAALFALTAYGFGLAAGAIYLASQFGSFEAALLISAGFAALALMILAGVQVSEKLLRSKHHQAAVAKRQSSETTAPLAGQMIEQLGPGKVILVFALTSMLNEFLRRPKSK